MNKGKKRTFVFFIFAGILLAFLLCFFSYGAYFAFTKQQREMVIAAVKSAPALPERFVEIYLKVNPGSENSFLHNSIANSDSDCPCKDAAVGLAVQMASGQPYKIAQLTFFIEEYATQEECLAFVMNNMYFANNKNGIGKASQYYYDKEAAKLTDDEMLELIAMSSNPYFFDKKRFPEELSKEVMRLKKE